LFNVQGNIYLFKNPSLSVIHGNVIQLLSIEI